jgi:glycosyltransferase involved in cell wall biosynthesis
VQSAPEVAGVSAVRPSPSAAKILFLIGTLDVGGTETQLVELVTRLDRQSFEPIVCCLATAGALAPRLRANGIAVHALGFRGIRSRRFKYLPNLLGCWRLCSQLWGLMRRERPAILHGMLFWAYILGTFVGRAAGIPIVIASRRSLGLFKTGRPHYALLEWIANRMTDLFIANSQAVRTDTIARERLSPADVIVIPNGLDLARFAVGPDPALAASLDVADRPCVIVVSNLIRYKGHEYFVRAWRDVLVKFPTAVAMLAGDGVFRPEIERMCDELKIRHSIRFLGVRNDVPALLALADVYVHPSLQEGYSNALLEAMAAGKAIVATTVGGNVEAISEGVTGLLVPAEDAAALERAMTRLLGDRQIAREMGERARRYVHERYEMNAMVRSYESVYARLLAARSVLPNQAGAAHADPVQAVGRRD